MKKIIVKIFISIYLLCFLTSCNDYDELNELSFVIATAIDKIEDENEDFKYNVTLQIVNPSEIAGGGGTIATGKALTAININGKGNDFIESIRNASVGISRPLFFGHNALLIIDEKIARDGINEVLDAFARNPQATTDVPVIVARDSSAKSIISFVTALEKLPAISNVQKTEYTEKALGEEFTTRVYQILETMYMHGQESTVTGVSYNKKSSKSETQENSQKIHPDNTFINGIGMFKNEKLIGWLDGKPALAAGLLLKESDGGSLYVPIKKGAFSINFTQTRTNIKTTFKDGVPTIHYNTKIRATLEEITSNAKLNTPKDMAKIEKQAEKELTKQIKKGISITQEEACDIFGFGENYRSFNSKEWAKIKYEWPEIYKEADVDVNVNIDIARTDLISTPLDKEERKG